VYHIVTQSNDKKERVIHTRVSETLESELRERASGLGISVSNLIRNVLQNTFGLVEAIVADSHRVSRSALGESVKEPISPTASASATSPGAVIGWQQIVLAVNALCAHCNEILPRGCDAAIGICDGAARPIVCLRCLEESRSGAC
jgi:hypothetical protein